MKPNFENHLSAIGRRNFLKSAGIGAIGVAGIGFLTSAEPISKKKPVKRTKEERLKQLASNSYAVNQLFKGRTFPGREERPETVQLKKKYGELTLFDFPQFTKDTYPGVKAMDLWSSLFGDFSDDSMFTKIERDGRTRLGDFDPSTISSKRYLDQLADKIASSGLKAVHISNNAPRNIADMNKELRREGIRVAKLWLDAAKTIGVKSMCHAKRWTRFPDVDINRCVRILNDADYKGYISFEYEAGGDPVEGTLKLMNDVIEALV